MNDDKSIEILARWKREHEVKALIEDMAARTATDTREIKRRREQAQMHRDNAALCAQRLAGGL